ncbi:hypothetical protein Aazo_0984 ['Nostoc azollae' 0708]|uniref:Uncharacterized protein n=1 Tax=Nostoc azollae (strain 0708) TaxID=551115 RepID=D7E284_NOSA0|nr:hypothetical protein Aazo_0984 ['Nostoc azollae' 0708]
MDNLYYHGYWIFKNYSSEFPVNVVCSCYLFKWGIWVVNGIISDGSSDNESVSLLTKLLIPIATVIKPNKVIQVGGRIKLINKPDKLRMRRIVKPEYRPKTTC